MQFLAAYKKLDNLCKELLKSETGVTSYINSMEQLRDRLGQNTPWEADYRKLKRYRYIRNKIVHEDDASEETLTNAADTQWLKQFYQRILDGTDPLAQYKKPRRKKEPPGRGKKISTKRRAKKARKIVAALLAILGIALLAYLYYIKYLL